MTAFEHGWADIYIYIINVYIEVFLYLIDCLVLQTVCTVQFRA